MVAASIRVSGDDIEIVNQLLLPHATQYLSIASIQDAHEAIKSMKIRGAPAIASLAALSLASYVSRAQKDTSEPQFQWLSTLDAFSAHIRPLLAYLCTARPTAVNLGQAMQRLEKCLDQASQGNEDVRSAIDGFILEARRVADEDVARNRAMSRWGGDWLLQVAGEQCLNILTVCNTGSLATSGYGTALGLITYLHENGKLGRAYFTQTAPYHQGSRLTALELQSLQIPSTMICDTMVGSLFQSRKIHAVAVGADRVARNGDTANKIGTYQAAVLAARHNIPFIVVAPVTTIDMDTASGSEIPIEQRPPIEACLARGAIYPFTDELQQATVLLTPAALDGTPDAVYNPSFDVTPAELIIAIVTEKGVATRDAETKTFDLTSIV